MKWLGWDATGDTWEPAHRLAVDDPQRVRAYLREHDDDAASAECLREYFTDAAPGRDRENEAAE